MENKRPWTITTICILGFIGTALSILLILAFLETVQTIGATTGAWYSSYFMFMTAAGFISMIGFWMMRKWSVVLYTLLAVIGCVVNIVTDSEVFIKSYGFLGMVLQAIVIAVGFYNFKKMR